MLLKITENTDIDPRNIMDIYAESNMENTDYFYPETEDKELALQKVESDFLEYIGTEFLSCPANAYWVLEENGVWVSALRLYKVKEGFYYIEALETRPDRRRQGCAFRLLNGLLEELKKQGAFRICDCVGKKNTASLKTHEKCGFSVVSDCGYNYLSDETDDRDFGMEYSYESNTPLLAAGHQT